MSEVTLSSAVRGSLLSLQNTTSLIDRTQGRLSTGLKVAGATDDPVAFFQSKALSDRAFDFNEKKDGIDQGVSSVSTALEAIESVESVVRQLKGIANSLKSATGSQFTDLISQFSQLRTQIGLLADDATYQGTNLVNNTTESLTVSFSEKTSSLITVNAVNVRESGLAIDLAALAATNSVNYTAATSFSPSAGETISVTYRGTTASLGSGDSFTFTYGTYSVQVAGNTQASVTISAGDTLTLTIQSAYGTGAASGVAALAATGLYALFTGVGGLATGAASATVGTGVAIATFQTNFLREGETSDVDRVIAELDTGLATLRANASTLGSNVALLQTRLDFTEQYVNTLEIGSGKLTLADINEEGANLLALQTRQQLGISALAFAGQAEQGILSLFR